MSKPNMIKRADGSYSQRGLWDNIRANKGSGKAPTKEMLKQEKKIKAKYEEGGITEETKTTETPKKPLVNWFNRTKEYEYSNVTDKKGNILLDPVTKQPLQKTIKTVEAPDSILGGKGFKKTIINEEEIKNIPAQKHNINLPIPTLAPVIAGSIASGLLGTNNGALVQTNKNIGENAIKGVTALLPFLAGAAGTTKLINKAKADKSFYINPDTIGEHILNTVTGIPYKQKIGSYNTPAMKKVINTRTVNKESNDTTSELTPRFLAMGGTINNQAMKTNKYNNGGTIHIKPENKGKFNATKKATGKTTEELTHSKNPVTKKRAIFAQNAAKWKHAEGGEIEKLGTDNTNVNIPKKDLTISRFKTGSKNYNEIPEAFRNLPLQTGRVDDASLDAVQALTGIGALTRAGKIGYGAYQLSKPNIINLSKTYRPTYNNALRQAGQALLPFAEGGEIDPKNTFGLTGNYSRTPNPEAIESNYKLAADYQRRLGNFNAGLNANLGFDHNLPLNTEQFNGSPTIIPNANLGLNVDYDRNNNNFSGSFNYNPINQGINAEVTYKKRFAGGGKTEINPIITKPMGPPTIGNNFINSNPLNYNLDFLNNANNSNFNYNQVQEDGGIWQGGLEEGDGSNFGTKMLSPEDQLFIKEMKKKQLISEYGNNEKIPHYGRGPRPQTGDENYVLDAYAKGGRVLPKYAEAGWLTKNKAGVGAGLGFAGDTTNLLFDNNVFGTRNKVTDSEGNELGEAQSDAGSQTQGALSGALKGASAGAALGPWGMAGGALIGGVAGFLTADTGAEDKLNQIKRERNAQISFKNMLGKGPIENNSIQTNSQSLYANGGMKTLNQNHPEATEEVELGESAMLPNGMNLAFGGETHENGGLETNLPEGTRIFSDRIKSGKRTIASIAKPIQNKIEKLKDNNSKAGQNTIKLFENQLDNLFNEQEEIKQQQDMAQQRKYFAKGGSKKSDNPVLGSINPKTGKPFTIEEIALNSNSTMQKPFGSEYAGNGNIYNGVQSRSFIPSVSITPNPSMTATDYQPSVIEKPFMLRYNGQQDTRIPFHAPDMFSNPDAFQNTIQGRSEYIPAEKGVPFAQPNTNYQPRPMVGDVQNQMILNQNNRNELVKTLTSKTATPTIVDPTSTYTDNPGDIPPPSEPRFNKGDIGTAGALGTSLLGNLIQRSNLNKVAPPRTLVAPTFTAGRTPVKADYSADLQSADNQFNAARRGVMMNSGNYSTQAGNLGQLRAEQLRNRSKILQNQNNANAVLMNEYQKAQADAINKNALSNYTTDQENMENLYNYNLWKTGQTNAADASAFNTSGQMFNNMVTGQNQLDAAEMYRRMYAQKVRDDLAFKAMGGSIPSKSEGDENWVLESRAPRNYFAKGGTVYSQKLQNVLKEDTNTKAAQMDAEYASYLNAKGQPLQDTFKSKVTGLEYKVLPRKEKDLYAANLWKDVHSTAPTKSQVAATTKALDGKKTSSPGAKTVANTHNSQVPQLEATLPEVVITGKRSLNPQQMMDNKFGKPQVSNQLPAVPSKPVPDWVNKANNAKPNFNQPNVNEPVNEKPVVNKPKLQTETPNWLKNPLQPKFNRNEVGEPDNSGSSFNPDTNESKIEKGKKYVNNVLKPAIQEGRKNLNEMDVNVAKKANIRSLSNIGENISKKIEKNWKERGEAPSPSEAAKLLLAGYNENYKQIIPTSIRSLAKDIVNNNLGTNMKITEDDLTQTEKTAILELANRKENLSKKDKNYSKSINSYNDYINDSLDGNQWSDIKNIRNTLGKFNPKQDGDTLRIKEAYNFNEKENNKVIKQYGDWVKDWKEKGYSSALAYVRASGSAFGSAGSTKGDDSKGTKVDIKLYNPKKRTLNK